MAEFEALGSGGSEAQFQQFLAYLFDQVSTGLVQPGVLTGLQVTQTSTASGSVQIAAGAGVAQDTVLNGSTPLVNNTTKTLDIFTSNPMGGTPRNDIVVFDAATTSIRSITGTPNAVPTDPTVPSTAFPLARLRHAASATTIPTAKIDDLRVLTSLAGAADEGFVVRGVPMAGASATKAGKRLHWGAYAIAGGSSSYAITHGAGFTPTSVVVTAAVPGVLATVDTFTSSAFTMKPRVAADGTNYTSAFTLYALVCE